MGGTYRWVGQTAMLFTYLVAVSVNCSSDHKLTRLATLDISVGSTRDLVSNRDDFIFYTICLQEMIEAPDSEIICVFWEFENL